MAILEHKISKFQVWQRICGLEGCLIKLRNLLLNLMVKEF